MLVSYDLTIPRITTAGREEPSGFFNFFCFLNNLCELQILTTFIALKNGHQWVHYISVKTITPAGSSSCCKIVSIAKFEQFTVRSKVLQLPDPRDERRLRRGGRRERVPVEPLRGECDLHGRADRHRSAGAVHVEEANDLFMFENEFVFG